MGNVFASKIVLVNSQLGLADVLYMNQPEATAHRLEWIKPQEAHQKTALELCPSTWAINKSDCPTDPVNLSSAWSPHHAMQGPTPLHCPVSPVVFDLSQPLLSSFHQAPYTTPLHPPTKPIPTHLASLPHNPPTPSAPRYASTQCKKMY